MISYENFRLPKRRDVRQLTDDVAVLTVGSIAEAVFSNDRYGVYAFHGTLRKSDTHGSLLLGGQWMESKGAPDKTLYKVLPTPVSQDTPSTLDIEALNHGDAVTAWLDDPHYGLLRVTGVALWSEVDQSFSVGGWFISIAGRPSQRLRALVVEDAVGTHELPVPGFLKALSEDVSTSE